MLVNFASYFLRTPEPAQLAAPFEDSFRSKMLKHILRLAFVIDPGGCRHLINLSIPDHSYFRLNVLSYFYLASCRPALHLCPFKKENPLIGAVVVFFVIIIAYK
ncbi:MAG: hypothetical protein ACYDA4_16460 [Ignavibacteriaceae bacterium]